MKLLAVALSVITLSTYANDSLLGQWALKLPYDSLYAGWLGVEKGADGLKCRMLWRWSSPWAGINPEFKDGALVFVRGTGKKPTDLTKDHDVVTARLVGDDLVVTLQKVSAEGKAIGEPVVAKGWRRPENGPRPDIVSLKFGKSIDLLADGLDGWESMNKTAQFAWSFKDGVLVVDVPMRKEGERNVPYANLKTKRADFRDFKLEYDVKPGVGSNSGVYLRGIYELQVMDTFGQPIDCHNMSAYYGRVNPAVAAEKPAGEWQHVTAYLVNGHLDVTLNGQKLYDMIPLEGVTGGAITPDETVKGPMYLQGDHYGRVEYRNMILTPIED